MRTTTFERGTSAFSILLVVVAFFLPLVLIAWFQAEGTSGPQPGAGEATVGIAVIMRATARRLLRAGSSNLLRTTLGAYSRAAARTMVRRVVKFAAHIMFGAISRDAIASSTEKASADQEEDEFTTSPSRNAIAVAIGSAGLFLSFLGILYFADSADSAAVATDRGMSLVIASLLAAVPMLLYALLNLAAAKMQKAKIRFQTAVDGLLLQAEAVRGRDKYDIKTATGFIEGINHFKRISGMYLYTILQAKGFCIASNELGRRRMQLYNCGIFSTV